MKPSRAEPVAFTLLVLLQLIPIWSVEHFPSDDGPAHVYNAIVMREFDQPDRAKLREYYARNPRLNPNWFSHVVLAGLTRFIPPPLAEKLLVSGYVLLLPFAVRYALGAINPANRWLAVLSLPFVYNFLFQKGFYNFSYSLAVYFLLIGYWLRHHERPTLRHGAMLGLLSLVLYFCHLVSVAQAYLLIGLLIVALVARDVVKHATSLSAAIRRHGMMAICAFAPTVILAMLFLSSQGTASEDVSIVKKILKLITLYSLVLFDSRERFLAAGLSLFIVAIAAWVLWTKWRRHSIELIDMLVVVAGVCALLVLIAPDQLSGGGLILDRMVLYPFLVLILWLGTHAYRMYERRAIQAFAVALTLVLLASRTVSYVRANSFIDEYLSAGLSIAPGATLLPIQFTDRLIEPAGGKVVSFRVFPLNHASGLLCSRRGLIDLGNYEAMTSYFPIEFRPGRSLGPPGGFEHEMDSPPRNVDFAGYPGRSGGGRVDYVLLWCVRPEQSTDPRAGEIFAQLFAGYDEVYRSSPRGYARLYRRKDLSGVP
jgi:hypothetical protein